MRRLSTVADQVFLKLRSAVNDQVLLELHSTINNRSVNGVRRAFMIKDVVDNDHTKGDIGCCYKSNNDLPSLSPNIEYPIFRSIGLTPIPAISEFACSFP